MQAKLFMICLVFLWLTVIRAVFGPVAVLVSGSQDLLVSTNSGKLMGKYVYLTNGFKVRAFLGIPFAEPPVGEYRFKAPVPKRRWRHLYNATSFGPFCYQPAAQMVWDIEESKRSAGKRVLSRKRLKDYPMSEDCLTLNIYSPVIEEGSNPLTVMVYFHGGSYYMNGGRLYPGEKLASLGVIIVTFNYRLGPLGFLSTGDDVSPGNYGLLDQVLVLTWVKHNIGYFGGDPDNVAIFGNSAGGASVSFHLLSPLSEGLFKTAIAQSGCSHAPWAIQNQPLTYAVKLAKNLGCPTSPLSEMVDCLRTVSADLILRKSSLANGLLVPFAPVVDGLFGGKFLPDHPTAIMRSGNFHGKSIPVVMGVTKDEVSIWFQVGSEMNIEHMRAFIQKRAKELLKHKGISEVNQAVVLHAIFVQYLNKRGMNSHTGKGQTMAVADFISDVGIKAPCIQFLQNLVEISNAPVYMYEFSYFSNDDARSNRQEWVGAYHESELQFLFGEPFLYDNSLRRKKDREISDMMMRLWINFAKHGNPTPKNHNPLNITWTEYTADHQVHLRLFETPTMAENYLTESVLFWNAFVPILSDYPIHEPRKKCVGVKKKWLLWTMIPIICIQTIICVGLCFYTFRKRRHLATHAPLSPENSTAV